MVVVCPPPSLFTSPPAIDCSVVVVSDCSGGSSAPCYDYVLLEAPGTLLASSSDLIIEIEDDDNESLIAADAEEKTSWDPLQHVGDLPRRPMSRFRKASIDVAFVAFTAVGEAGLVRAALDDGFVTLLLMLPFILGFVYMAVLMYLVVTRDCSTASVGQGSN